MTVDRTTYGQYDRCSRNTSSCLFGCGVGPSTGAGVTNAHKPTRRWHNAQCSTVVSIFVLPTAADWLTRMRISGLGELGVGIPFRNAEMEETDGDREETGVEDMNDPRVEFAREIDGDREWC